MLGEGYMSAACPKCSTTAFKIFYDSVGRPVAKCVECGTETPFAKSFGAAPLNQQHAEDAKDALDRRDELRPSD